MTTDPADSGNRDRRLLAVLQRLLSLQPGDLSAAMTEAADQLAELLSADKVDVFFHVSAEDALVAEGTSETPMGRREHELGLDRLPLAGGGRAVEVFRTGQSHLTEHADQDPDELRAIVDDLGVRSSLTVPLEVAGARRGVLMVTSATAAAFNQADLEFLQAIAQWIGLTATRLAQVQALTGRAAAESLRHAGEQSRFGLTPRQRDVAELVSSGMNNQEIAERLVLERGTVANHVASILSRLGFRSRTQIAVWVIEGGLGDAPPPPARAE